MKKVFARTLPLLGSIALCLAQSSLQAQDYTWISPVSGNWSESTNWLGELVPPTGGSTTLSLKFAPETAAGAYTATNDFSGSFSFNTLEFAVPGSSNLTLATTLQPIVASGTGSKIIQNGAGTVTISSLALDPADGTTTVSGTGFGNVVFNALSGLSSGETLRVATGPDSPVGQLVTISGVNSISGIVQLDSGNLALGDSKALGTATLSVNGGTLRMAGTNYDIQNAIELGDSLVIVHPFNGTLSGVISSSNASAGLQLRTSGINSSLTLRAPATYTGATVIDYGPTSSSFIGSATGVLELSGDGSILETSALDIRAGGLLTTYTDPVGVTNRLGDSTPVFLRGGRLRVSSGSNSVEVQSEQVGPISVSGTGTIEIGSSGQSLDLTAASLARLQRGTVLFRTPTLLTPGTTPARILFNAAPTLVGGAGTGTATSIIPYAYGSTSDGSTIGLVTYDAASGVRLLNSATEYASTLAGATAATNVRLATSTNVSADATMNALVLSGISSITGTSTLMVTSGTILTTSASFVTFAPGINFGTAEGHIITTGTGPALEMHGPISGSGGLTKSGPNGLRLRAANTFTGPLTINEGSVSFSALSQLGADTGAITLAANSELFYLGVAGLTLNRPIQLNGGGSIGSDTATLDLAAPISGEGVLQTFGTVRLSATNTHQGQTAVVNGTLEFSDDGALGVGDLWLGGRAMLLGPWSTNRTVRLINIGTIDTNGFNAQLDGPMTGSHRLVKTGTGKLTLRDTDEYYGVIQAKEGHVVVDSDMGLSDKSVIAEIGAKITGRGNWERLIDIRGTLAVGVGVGELNVQRATLAGNSTLELELASPTDYDLLEIAEKLYLESSVNLSLALSYDPEDFVDVFTIMRTGSVESLFGNPLSFFLYQGNELTEGEKFYVGSQHFQISYASGDGNDVALYAVPEPGTGMMLSAALIGYAALRRRRSVPTSRSCGSHKVD